MNNTANIGGAIKIIGTEAKLDNNTFLNNTATLYGTNYISSP